MRSDLHEMLQILARSMSVGHIALTVRHTFMGTLMAVRKPCCIASSRLKRDETRRDESSQVKATSSVDRHVFDPVKK